MRLLETILWTREDGYFLLDEHLDRLLSSADFFGYRCELEEVRRALSNFVTEFESGRHRVRLLVDRCGEISLEHVALGDSPRRDPVCVRLAKRPVDASNRFLYHKTTRRDVYEEALAEAGDCEDVILYNADGFVTESCISNIVIDLHGRRVTPPVSCGLLGGTYRAHLLQRGRLSEEKIPISDLAPGRSIRLINSVRGEYPAVIIG